MQMKPKKKEEASHWKTKYRKSWRREMKKIRKRKVMLLMDDEYYDGDDAGIELAYRWHCFVIGGVKSLHNQRGRIYKCRPI